MNISTILRCVTLLLAAALISTSLPTTDAVAQAGGNEACGQDQRTRKAWSSLNSSEKSLYLEAIDTAIKNGAIKEFAAIHVEPNGESQAHRSCGFFSWHRRLLIALESYLRDQNPKFACVTLPYYDVQTAYVRQAAGECANLYECSDILQEIGGNRAGNKEVYLTQNGQTAVGFPVTGYPLSDECDDNDVCGYTVRTDMTTKPVPSGAGFASFLSIIRRSNDYATFLEGIQFGVHNEVHNAVGGTMATFASPRDIFFYSWHAAIDMYLHVYHLCNFGTDVTKEELLSASKAFTKATDSCDGVSGVGPNATIVQNVVVDGQTMDVTDHPTLGKYFSHVGSEMWHYGDVAQLGDYSYSYELPDIMTQQLLSNSKICPAFNENPSAPTETTASYSPPADLSTSGSGSLRGSVAGSLDGGSDDSPDDVGYGYFKETNGCSHSGIHLVNDSTGEYWEWVQKMYDGLYDRFDGNMDLVVQQMHYAECEVFNQVYRIEELSDDFVENFHLASTRPICGKKVEEIESGDVVVACKTDEFKPQAVEFVDDDAIEDMKNSYVPTSTATEQYMDTKYYADAQARAQQTGTAAANNGYGVPYLAPTPAPTNAASSPHSPDHFSSHKHCQ
ncbi:Common central domain of tyrosinase [Phytophthora infestans]|uniref:Common central domain of tyrosinase n=1 Tax=Phytophthora infestans TaxID=4787 RepID=A0A8S9UGL0_PHYIN|nr:Common central domain of tyrosinase [Phytophthora infestans]